MIIYDNTRIGRIDDLLNKCWGAVLQIGIDWKVPFQRLKPVDWERSEHLYKTSNLTNDARELHELTRRNGIRQEINLTLASFATPQQRTYYDEVLREFLDEVNSIGHRLEDYFEKAMDNRSVVHDREFEWDVSSIFDSILDINLTVISFLSSYYDPYFEQFDSGSKSNINTESAIDLKVEGSITINKGRETHWLGVWRGGEERFNRIVRNYANEYIDIIDDRLFWKNKRPGIKYLAGFTNVCIQKGWIARHQHDATDFKRFYGKALNVSFDAKPFQQSQLYAITSEFTKPFSSIPLASVTLLNPSNPSTT